MQVSIIMPAYNAEQTISTAINSVINQTFSSWELLVINDCSRDTTKQIILEYTKKDERIFYIENSDNLGVAKTRNKGVIMAHFPWIAFLDSDDLWEADKLEMQIKCIERCDAKFIFTASAFIDKTGHRLNYCLQVPEKVTFRELLKQNIISCSSVLVEKELLLKYPMIEKKMHEDYATWLEILKNESITAYGINQPLLIYRISANSKSGNKGKAALMHWRVYKHIGLPFLPSIYYFLCYTIRNLKKYRKIWSNI